MSEFIVYPALRGRPVNAQILNIFRPFENLRSRLVRLVSPSDGIYAVSTMIGEPIVYPALRGTTGA
ncbi:MAG: hypothetical protein SCALA702_07250 [Melioribacteraceae bacterium]|nr:MAG: hypothetical protein SCALA702_07250 [Melioribacteraceae bacterium]